MAEVDFLLESVSQVLDATSVMWGKRTAGKCKQGKEWRRGRVGDKNGSEQ